MERNHVRGPQQPVEVDQPGARGTRGCLGREGIMRDDIHPKTARAARHLAANAADPDQAERLPAELAADEFRACPFAGADAAVGIDHASQESQRERDGVFRRRDDVSERRVHDVDAARCCRGHVDVVHADPRASNDHEALRRIKDRRGHLGLAAHDETVDIGDERREIGLLQTRGLADLAARAEQREALFGKRVRDVNDAAAASDESRPRRSPALRSTSCGLRDAMAAVAGSPRTHAAPRSSRRPARPVG